MTDDIYRPEILKMLVLSTVHIAPETDEKLRQALHDQYEHLPLSHDEIHYGWLIWVPDDWEIMQDLKAALAADGFDGLFNCLQRAEALDCHWLKLDCDAAADPSLPTYDWQ